MSDDAGVYQKEEIDELRQRIDPVFENEELNNVFHRRCHSENKNVEEILIKNGYPPRSNPANLGLDNWRSLNKKFCKDGYIYLLRGDHPNQESGFYSVPYGYMKLTTEEIAKNLKSPKECGYLLYGDKRYLKKSPFSDNIPEELACLQSAIGGSSYISTTINIPCAVAGTDNNPDSEEQKNYRIYVVKVKEGSAFKRPNSMDNYGMDEEEYLIPDFIGKDEIEISFPRDDISGVYRHLKETVGLEITPEDVGLKEKDLIDENNKKPPKSGNISFKKLNEQTKKIYFKYKSRLGNIKRNDSAEQLR